jgi:hypothetical protein
LTDANVVGSNKEVAEAVFYAICSSLQGGRDAHSLATTLYDDAKTLDPFQAALVRYFCIL